MPDTVFFSPARAVIPKMARTSNGCWEASRARITVWLQLRAPATDWLTSPPTLRIIPEEADLDIRVVPDSRLLARPEVLAAVDSARASWETAIRGDLPGSTGTKQMVEDCIDGADFDLPDGDFLIDDILVLVTELELDGPGGHIAVGEFCLEDIRPGTIPGITRLYV